MKPAILRNAGFGIFLALGSLCAHADSYAIRHYKISFQATSGTFSGQTYTGSFDVDRSGLIGFGVETLPSTTSRIFS